VKSLIASEMVIGVCMACRCLSRLAPTDAQSSGTGDLAWNPTHLGQHRRCADIFPVKLIEPLWQQAAVLSLPSQLHAYLCLCLFQICDLSRRLAIPSMVPGAEVSPIERIERPVWQIAFYAPLEETKGIKIFCDAVEQLPRTVLDRPGFEVSMARERESGNHHSAGLRMSVKDPHLLGFLFSVTCTAVT